MTPRQRSRLLDWLIALQMGLDEQADSEAESKELSQLIEAYQTEMWKIYREAGEPNGPSVEAMVDWFDATDA